MKFFFIYFLIISSPNIGSTFIIILSSRAGDILFNFNFQFFVWICLGFFLIILFLLCLYCGNKTFTRVHFSLLYKSRSKKVQFMQLFNRTSYFNFQPACNVFIFRFLKWIKSKMVCHDFLSVPVMRRSRSKTQQYGGKRILLYKKET